MKRVIGLMVAVVAFVAACGGAPEFSRDGVSASEAAVELIESQAFAQRLGLDAITDADCDAPNELVGTVFSCTGLSGGEVADIEATIDGPDRIFANVTNVVAGNLLPDYAASAVEELNRENGFDLPPDAIDCGTRSVVLNENRQHVCTLTEPTSGQDLRAVITFFDLELAQFVVEVQSGE